MHRRILISLGGYISGDCLANPELWKTVSERNKLLFEMRRKFIEKFSPQLAAVYGLQGEVKSKKVRTKPYGSIYLLLSLNDSGLSSGFWVVDKKGNKIGMAQGIYMTWEKGMEVAKFNRKKTKALKEEFGRLASSLCNPKNDMLVLSSQMGRNLSRKDLLQYLENEIDRNAVSKPSPKQRRELATRYYALIAEFRKIAEGILGAEPAVEKKVEELRTEERAYLDLFELFEGIRRATTLKKYKYDVVGDVGVETWTIDEEKLFREMKGLAGGDFARKFGSPLVLRSQLLDPEDMKKLAELNNKIRELTGVERVRRPKQKM